VGATTLHLITCEYPPKSGGVSHYTAALASALVDAGCEVHVWAPGEEAAPIRDPNGATVHRIAGRFGPRGLVRLSRGLGLFAAPRTIVVQYVPHGFGWRAMNFPFVAWVFARRVWHRDDVRVMFHEVAYPWVRRPLRHNLVAAVNRVMAALLTRACTSAYVSIPGWAVRLRAYGGQRLPITWLPIPSTLPADPPAELAARVRSELTGGNPSASVVGHFGTYGSLVTPFLGPALRGVLEQAPQVRVALIGAGGDRWRADFLRDHPELISRVVAPGSLPATEAAAYLAACDVVVLPYPDGASSRRTTLSAALALGVPIVANSGPLTDPVTSAGPIVFAPSDRLADATLELLEDADRRGRLSREARRFYEEHFAISRTVAALLSDHGSPHSRVPRCRLLAGC
jgi:glycosyltransferase involved in cell wall biosynthesis